MSLLILKELSNVCDILNVSNSKNNKWKLSTEQVFVITLDESTEVEFYFSVLKKEFRKANPDIANIRFCIRKIHHLFNTAKRDRPMTLLMKQSKSTRNTFLI